MKSKSLISLLLALVVLLGTLMTGIFTVNAESYTEDIYTYTVSSNKATITACDTAISGAVEIPSSLGGYPVTAIGDRAFYGCGSITSVVIPDTVTSIGTYAFNICSSMTSVTIPNSVKTIKDYSFFNCKALKQVHIIDLSAWCSISFNSRESNPCYYGAALYIDGSIITVIDIPENIKSINNYAFYGCDSITTVNIHDTVTKIGRWAFYDCSSLKNINIGNSVTSIGTNAFEKCTSLVSVNIPDSVITIDDSSFNQCNALTDITIGSKVRTIGTNAFRNCGFKFLTIPNSVTAIKNYAFYGCYGLTSVTLGSGITSIGTSGFANCNALKEVHITDLAAYCKITFADNNSSPLYFAKKLYINGELVTKLVIPDGVTSIKPFSFNYCSSLKSVEIPESVTSIGNNAFISCASLTTINIPNSVTSLGSYMLANCTSLTTIDIPDSVTSIGAGVFAYCTNLTAYCNVGNVSESLTSLGYTHKCIGDFDDDKALSGTDAVLMRKVLLEQDVENYDEKVADINADNSVDVRDLVGLKRNLIEIVV